MVPTDNTIQPEYTIPVNVLRGIDIYHYRYNFACRDSIESIEGILEDAYPEDSNNTKAISCYVGSQLFMMLRYLKYGRRYYFKYYLDDWFSPAKMKEIPELRPIAEELEKTPEQTLRVSACNKNIGKYLVILYKDCHYRCGSLKPRRQRSAWFIIELNAVNELLRCLVFA